MKMLRFTTMAGKLNNHEPTSIPAATVKRVYPVPSNAPPHMADARTVIETRDEVYFAEEAMDVILSRIEEEK